MNGAQDYPVVKYLRRPLYFEVELLYSRDPQAELFLDNCWATYSADRNSSPKWDVVVDSCENSADEYLTIFHPVSSNARVLFPSHLKRFEVKMFSFTSGWDALKGQIYFHCSVVIQTGHQTASVADGAFQGNRGLVAVLKGWTVVQ
ncbi:zona pellucida sperm-binding protein 2-like [Acipenser ruthenus]|uniref:zona pellucida sperm-binding protein 2-like n=1 Tax=Acipenser ruthenus TaxID=7906 RepID=UPI0027424639|nr:zona pellucida sperm-binding protein 2-like [Acipenser ruthenus]